MTRSFVTFLLIALLGACAINNVNTDYDPSVQFTGVGRYSWVPEPKGGAGFPSLDQQRIRIAVDNALMMHAMRPVDPKEAQLWVQGGVELREVRDVSTMEIGTSQWHPFLIGGDTIVRVDRYTEAHIYIQFIDPKDSRVVWKGQLATRWNENMPPAKREKILHDSAVKILAEFPPKLGK